MIDDLIFRLREVARTDQSTQWFDVVPYEQFEYVESVIDISFPQLLKRCYSEISNGGFGPGYGITGLPGGYKSSWGDLIQTVNELRRIDDCEEEWLPLIDWGCGQFSCVDCGDNEAIVTVSEGEFFFEDYTLQTLLERWCDGEIPDFESGSFCRPE